MATLLAGSVALLACGIVETGASATTTRHASRHGECVVIEPQEPPRALLIVAHGSLGDGETAMEVAERYAARWADWADEHGVLVLVPAFDRDRYQRAYGGYRGLFGRDVGADAFVLGLVDAHADRIEDFDGRIMLYGHSAGGQFVCRFLMRHPDRIRAAVLSAPGRYTYPDPTVPWPYGTGKLERTLDWGTKRTRIVVQPDQAACLRAAGVPVRVIVGAEDTELQPWRPGHGLRTRVGLARHWVDSMQRLAAEADAECGAMLEIVEGIGHSSRRLTQPSQAALAEALQDDPAARGSE